MADRYTKAVLSVVAAALIALVGVLPCFRSMAAHLGSPSCLKPVVGSMTRFVVITRAAGVAGCSSDARLYPGFFGQNVVGNETYVTVSNVWNEMDALPLAEKHCAQFGKAARFNHMEGQRAIFDCLPFAKAS